MLKKDFHKKMGFFGLGLAVVTMPYSIFLCHLGLIIFILNWLGEWNWKEKFAMIKRNPLAWLLPAFFVLHLIGMMYTENREHGWAIIEKKAFLLLPIALASSQLLTKRQLNHLFKLFVASCFIGTVICISHSAWLALHHTPFLNFGSPTYDAYELLNPGSSSGWMYFSYVSLASGIHIHPTYFGLYLILCILILIFHVNEPDRGGKAVQRFIRFGLLFHFAVFIVFLSSRIITMSLVMAVAVAVLVTFTQGKKTIAAVSALLTVFMILGFTYINPVSRYRVIQEPYMTTLVGSPPSLARNSMDIRASLWWLGKKSLDQTNFWIGAGTGDVDITIKSLGDRHNKHNILNSYDPHSQFLYAGIGLGFIGFLIFVLCLLLPAFFAYRRRFYLLLTFTLVFAAVCLTESALELQKGIVFFSLFSSLFLFHEKEFVVPSAQLTYA